MTTAGAVATELRRIADALDKEPEVEVAIPTLWFWSYGHKKSFLNLMRLMPRPFEKEYDNSNLIVSKSDLTAIQFQARVDRSAVCTLVEPAKPAVYKCEPLLSDEEEAALTQEGTNVISYQHRANQAVHRMGKQAQWRGGGLSRNGY